MGTQAKHTETPWGRASDNAYKILSPGVGLLATTSYHWVDPVSARLNAEFIVKACNNHDKFVQLAQMVAGKMYDDGVGHSAVQTAEELLDELGVEYMMKPQTRYIQKT